MAATTRTPRSTTKAAQAQTFTAEERAAMKERSAEVRSRRTGKADPEKDEKAVAEAIAGLADADRVLAERIHAVVLKRAPGLAPRLWYGMPAWARDGKVVCFFQPAEKFKARYATLGFSDEAHLDDGSMWPAAYALTKLTKKDEAVIGELIARAAG